MFFFFTVKVNNKIIHSKINENTRIKSDDSAITLLYYPTNIRIHEIDKLYIFLQPTRYLRPLN